MARKKQNSNLVGWAILGLLAFGIFQFGIMGNADRPAPSAAKPAAPRTATQASPASVPLDVPRFVNVASLNVRHAPSQAADLITALPRGTRLRVLDRQDGWLLVDLNPTLEGWVTERFTTTDGPAQYRPPAAVPGSR
ncbi:SH3 domain-containing protein [Devosia elaeis]|uniref:SH3b domain-containing protein n=1 Tax=Devosia elaeis TaxID=1770058 RepID=A0A178HZT4_9HYPH|nr:SH3 domain-containing protein [Devosia elaeis]OAM78352.1 hypothetical protein A3840_06460 [Devosia elaeis]